MTHRQWHPVDDIKNLMSDSQFTMNFISAPSYGRDDFILGACNALAADWIDRWPDWPGRIKGIVIEGPEASGKSHLATIWQKLSKARLMTKLVETDLNDLAQTPHLIWDHPTPGPDWADDILFHYLNSLTEIGGSLLVLTRQPMATLNWTLNDNNSRMRGLVNVSITTPDDDVQLGLLYKHADDMGLPLDADVARYIVTHADRSFKSARDLMTIMNDACLKGQRRMTIPVAKSVLEQVQHKPIED